MEVTRILLQINDERSGSRFKNHIEGDVGFDLEVWDTKLSYSVVHPHSFTTLPTGISVKMGNNSWGMIRPRSSAHFKRGLFVMEGTIDSGYTGKLFINVFNPSDRAIVIPNGDSLAQLIPIPKFDGIKIIKVNKLPETERGNKGFGSTDSEDIPFFARNEDKENE